MLLSYKQFTKLNESLDDVKLSKLKIITYIINDPQNDNSQVDYSYDMIDFLINHSIDEFYENFPDFDYELDEQVINEVDSKDIMRLEDIKKKSAGEESKMISLASTMAKLITDKYKALNRGLAAQQVLGSESKVISRIFFNRAVELGIDTALIPDESAGLGKLFGADEDEIKLGSKRSSIGDKKTYRDQAILPTGKVDLDSGKNKIFDNIYDESGTLEIWKKSDGNHVMVFTSGTPSTPLDSYSTFVNDQTYRPMFSGTLVDYIEVENAKLLIPKYGRSLSMYVYK